jgi:hypothetical protein
LARAVRTPRPLSNILIVAVPAEIVLAQAVDHMTCLKCVLECVARVNGEDPVRISCNGGGFGRVVKFDDYVRPAAVGEFEELAMAVEYRIKWLTHFVIFECRFRDQPAVERSTLSEIASASASERAF